MKRRRWLVWLRAALALGWMLGASSSAHAAARIVRVEEIGAGTPRIGLQDPYMKKFTSPTVNGGRRGVRVVWESEEVVPAGTLIIFEYRTKRKGDTVRYLKTERPRRGRQEALFWLDERDELTAWRIRVADGTRTVAARASSNWR